METARAMQGIDKKSLSDNDLLVRVGAGPIFHYTACGLDSVYVEGALEEHPTYAGWYKINNIAQVHHDIGTHVLAECASADTKISAKQFRFMRKDMGLTLDEMCADLGIDSTQAAAWEAEDGFMPEGAKEIIGLFVEYRALGYEDFLASRRTRSIAA